MKATITTTCSPTSAGRKVNCSDHKGNEEEELDMLMKNNQSRQKFIDNNFKIVQEDNQKFLTKFKDRVDRVGIQLPTVEVRFENLNIEADCYVGNRALPTLLNSARNMGESLLEFVGLKVAKRTKLTILKDASGIIKPSRMTLLIGPPSSGKTTFLLALAGRLDPSLKMNGKITYNGHEFNEFVPKKTALYVSQNDVHACQMTVKETFDFSARCQGVCSRNELLTELQSKEKSAGIVPDSEVDLFMKGTAKEGFESNLQTEYILKILGLDICKDTIVGDGMNRGISGGQKKRVTTGEMLVGPSKTIFMDEISTGLDSSTTYQIVKCLQQTVHLTQATLLMSLLQPEPETFNLFDDIILISDGQIIYQGPRDHILEFFEICGFCCPKTKGTADFLQEVTSKKEQEQYWADKSKPYHFVSVTEFSNKFKEFHVGLNLKMNLKIPYNKNNNHKSALVFTKNSVPKMQLLKANLAKEWLLLKRDHITYISRIGQTMLMAVASSTLFLRTQMHNNNEVDGSLYLGPLLIAINNNLFTGFAELPITTSRLPVFYKQRDTLFYPAWTFSLANFLVRIPISFFESVLWVLMTYYPVGLAPNPDRIFKHFLLIFLLQQMASGLYKFIASVCRTAVIASIGGSLAILLLYMLGGFILPLRLIPKWWVWGYWISPLSYAYNAITVNEMLAPRWMDKLASDNETKLGVAILENIGVHPHNYWVWIGIAALLGFAILFNVLFTIALQYLNPIEKHQVIIPEEVAKEIEEKQHKSNDELNRRISKSKKQPLVQLFASIDGNTTGETEIQEIADSVPKRGMVLPFVPLAMSFNNINYFVEMPKEVKSEGVNEDKLQLLNEVTGAFRPGVLTALMGVSGAGKTTLLDVLSGRKTGGYIEGDIRISGFPKNQETFARISGYCEQNDIHSSQVTVEESLIYSAFLRLPKEVSNVRKMIFVKEVMELVELESLKDAIVGEPGMSGLSTEQRKRLTIAVELVSNPSIIFMDEPTSGLDARAASIVMRTVRNTVNTGRTVVCTIHQPSIEIFEAFDELLLMKTGGQVIYSGPLGRNFRTLIDYFEAVPGVTKIKDKYNPATWMLEASSIGTEVRLGINFGDYYKTSDLYKLNKALVEELGTPMPGAKDLHFPTKYSQSTWEQFKLCLWKQWWSYWRNPDYNFSRFFITLLSALLFGTVCWMIGKELKTAFDLTTIIGVLVSAVTSIGINNCSSVQPIVAGERPVFYRERAARMYSALSYAIAQVVIEIPYVFVQTTYSTLIVYSMVGFEWKATKFFWFFFILFFTFLYFTYYGMMTMSIAPNGQISAIFASTFYGYFSVFSGFYIPKPKIPKWWIWYYWICPVAWTVYGLIISQYGDLEDIIKVPGMEDQMIKVYIKDHFGYDSNFMGVVAGVLISFTVFFAFMFTVCTSILNFQKR